MVIAPGHSRNPSAKRDETFGASRNLYGHLICVGVGVGAGDAEVDISYIIFMMKARYKKQLGTARDSLPSTYIHWPYVKVIKPDKEVLNHSPVE